MTIRCEVSDVTTEVATLIAPLRRLQQTAEDFDIGYLVRVAGVILAADIQVMRNLLLSRLTLSIMIDLAC